MGKLQSCHKCCKMYKVQKQRLITVFQLHIALNYTLITSDFAVN